MTTDKQPPAAGADARALVDVLSVITDVMFERGKMDTGLARAIADRLKDAFASREAEHLAVANAEPGGAAPEAQWCSGCKQVRSVDCYLPDCPKATPVTTSARALGALISAWESLPEGHHTPKHVQRWLLEEMKPAFDAARAALANPPASQVPGREEIAFALCNEDRRFMGLALYTAAEFAALPEHRRRDWLRNAGVIVALSQARGEVAVEGLRLLVDLEAALVLTAEHGGDRISVADFVRDRSEFKRVQNWFHDNQDNPSLLAALSQPVEAQ